MPAWYYFSRPFQVAFHDCTRPGTNTSNVKSLLGLGLKFIPTPRHTTSKTNMEASLNKLDRDIRIACYFSTTMEKDPDFNPKMFVRSKWEPPPRSLQPELRHRLSSLKHKLTADFEKRRGHRNLLPHQLRALSWLQKQDDLMVVHCDKNLGPAIIEKTEYPDACNERPLQQRKCLQAH